MIWWTWLVLGLFLLLLELLTPGGFYLLFFGVAAALVGLLAAVNFAGPLSVQWILFSVFSIVSVLLFRRPLLAKIRSRGATPEVDSLVGEIAVSLGEIPAGAIGQAELRGTAWTARNIGETALASGQRSRVARVEGLTLFIREE